MIQHQAAEFFKRFLQPKEALAEQGQSTYYLNLQSPPPELKVDKELASHGLPLVGTMLSTFYAHGNFFYRTAKLKPPAPKVVALERLIFDIKANETDVAKRAET